MDQHNLNIPQNGLRKVTLRSFPQEQPAHQQIEHISQDNAHKINADVSPYTTKQTGGLPLRNSIHENTVQKPIGTLPSSAPSIFVIDDSITVRMMTETILHQAGYKIMSFPNGIDAIKWLVQPGSWVPDIILVDLSLPKIDGYEVIRMFKERARFAQTNYIIISRRDGIVDKLKGRLAGAQGYLIKPFTAHDLLTAVRTCLANKPAV